VQDAYAARDTDGKPRSESYVRWDTKGVFVGQNHSLKERSNRRSWVLRNAMRVVARDMVNKGMEGAGGSIWVSRTIG